jgi:hypothetical protein
MTHGRIDKTGRGGRHPRHDYTLPSFNALDTISDLLCPGASCWALGLYVTTRP